MNGDLSEAEKIQFASPSQAAVTDRNSLPMIILTRIRIRIREFLSFYSLLENLSVENSGSAIQFKFNASYSMHLSLFTLKRLLSLSKRRDALAVEVQRIEGEILRTFGTASAKGGFMSGEHRAGNGQTLRNSVLGGEERCKRARRNPVVVKRLILEALKEAGDSGIAVKEAAERFQLRQKDVHHWFLTTGKRSGAVGSVDRSSYRLRSAETRMSS